MRTLIASAFLLALLASAACSRLGSNGDAATSGRYGSSGVAADSGKDKFDVDVFERNHQLWRSKNIQNYTMVVRMEGFKLLFAEKAAVEVAGGEMQTVRSLSNTGPGGSKAYKMYETVERLFELLDEENKNGAKKIYVTYDETLGYPKAIDIDRDGVSGND